MIEENQVGFESNIAQQNGEGLSVRHLSAYFGHQLAIRDISIEFKPGQITALIGPSGSGKSTLLRNLNRLHELIPGARAEGEIWLDGANILAPEADPVQVRRRIGMVFQKPNPFPTLSIRENVIAGLRLVGEANPYKLEEVTEESLKKAFLSDEVKDKLDEPGIALSGGQQQRLSIARTIAVEPEIILMDEATASLDPIATMQIEDLMRELKKAYTIIAVTHNLQQAARVSDQTAFMLAEDGKVGELIEYGNTNQIFTSPHDKRTQDYIGGKFG
jgi:phosphate transport system ATP-binding protein